MNDDIEFVTEIYRCINYNIKKEECKACDSYGRANFNTEICYKTKSIENMVNKKNEPKI